MLRFKLHCALLSALLTSTAVSAADDHGDAYATPEEAQQDPQFAVQGEYVSVFGEDGLQVVAQGDGQYLVVTYAGGLPGYGWDGSEETRADADSAAVEALTEGYTHIHRASPTLGAEPPQGAVVLFDGTPESLAAHWKEGAQVTEDGLLMPGVTSTDVFQDYFIHLEFRLPYMPAARGQGRGNSGYYLQGRYEIQMLDSFGLEGKDNECGGIYSVSAPDVNMCLPPLAWQTYDVDFTAARFDDAGNKTENAHAHVWHNGVPIHDGDVPQITPSGTLNTESREPGPVFLQNHGNPVRYRNIWVLPR